MSSRNGDTSGMPSLRWARDRSLTRRDFLKSAGIGVAALGAAGGLGGALSACGSGDDGGGDGGGREIKVGFVAPLTGALAAFGEPDQYCYDRWVEAVKGGLTTADGVKHPVKIIMKDSQSDTNRAASVTGDVITNDGVDIVMAASTADTVPPVADQCEALGVPCVTNDCPWQSYFFGRGGDPEVGFKWTYHSWWGLEGVTAVFIDMWNQLNTNKKIGEMWPNDGDGNAWADAKTGQPPFLKEAGYTVVDGGRYQNGTQDFTAQIAKFKDQDCDIVSGVMIPPDFTNFWKQCAQQGFQPKACTVGKALLFPSSLEALGDIGNGLTTECWWSPNHPFASSLTGESCSELAADYENKTKKQWTQPLLHYAVFEVVADAITRTENIDDKESILKAIKDTDLETIGGRVTWTAGGALNPVPNVCTTPIVGGQWVKGQEYPFDLVVVSNSVNPEVPKTSDIQELQY